MKTMLLSVSLALVSVQAFANCSDMKVLQRAAEKSYSKDSHAQAQTPAYMGTTKTGKDKWEVPTTVNEECISSVIIFTKANSCQVLNVINLGLAEGACG